MAGAGFLTFIDGDILTAAQVNTYLMQQSVMVFADSTARSTAITAPSEGMVTYLKNTNAVEKYDGSNWVNVNDNTDAILKTIVDAKGDLIVGTAADTVDRLAVGTNGQVLTADSTTATGLKWGTGSSGALVKISASTFSTQSTVTFDNVFTSTYRNYLLLADVIGSESATVNFRYRASGSDITAGNYYFERFTANGTTLSGARSSLQTSAEFLTMHANNRQVAEMVLYTPQIAQASSTIMLSTDSDVNTSIIFRNIASIYNQTTQMDGIKIIPSSGTISGTIVIYGYEN